MATLVVCFTTVIISCKKKADEDPAPASVAPTGKFRVEFEHLIGTEDLAFNTANTEYTNNVSETYNITKLKYYVSNVVLIKDDNSEYVVPESYFLIDASNANTSLISFDTIPEGKYTSMRFILGVDSTRNVSGAQEGALDTGNDMYWGWNSGYIFFKLEGSSPQSTATDNMIQYHIGGFRDANNTNALKTINISFGTSVLNVTETGNPQMHLSVDVSQVLKTPNDISFATNPACHMPGAMAKSIADNYADMFTFEHIHN